MTTNILGILWATFTLTHVRRRSLTVSTSIPKRNVSCFFILFLLRGFFFVILRFCVTWSFLLHNRTPYFVDHMSLILIFPISITAVGRVLEVFHFTTTTITTDSLLPLAQSCRLKVYCRNTADMLFANVGVICNTCSVRVSWHPHCSLLHSQKVPQPLWV